LEATLTDYKEAREEKSLASDLTITVNIVSSNTISVVLFFFIIVYNMLIFRGPNEIPFCGVKCYIIIQEIGPCSTKLST